jgi:small subunit ribosomal protein S6
MHMKEYESTFVLDPAMDETAVDLELNKIREFLTDRSVQITEVQKWGRRKLAYEIRKKKEGVYTLIRFKAGPGVPPELDRRYRLNENMLRYLTVLYEAPPVGEPGMEGTPAEGAHRRETGEMSPRGPADWSETRSGTRRGSYADDDDETEE